MLRTEERTVRLPSAANAQVDGVVRVRSLQLGIANNRYVVEQHEPVAVSMHIDGKTERVPINQPRLYTGIAAYVGVAIAARIAARILTHRSKRRT